MKSLRRYAGIVSAASVPPLILFSTRFARTVILSHLLEPADLGAAVALATIFGTCELLSDVGLDQFVMVKIGVDRAQAVAAAAQIGFVRGTVLAILIAVGAPIIAGLFGASGHVDSIRWLSLVPLAAGVRNWRTVQVQNEYSYHPQSISVAISSISAVIAVFLAAAWLRDERAMAASLIVEAAVYSLVSHLVLSRERVSVVDRQVRNEALRFGLPLMLNGIGLTALSQADRIIVSNLLGLIMLASYSLTVGLAIIPISVISIVLTKILMAFIARSLAEPSDASQHAFIAGWLPCIVGAAYALCIGALLDVAVPLVYGRHFQVSVGAHALITIIVFMRICRIGPTSVLLAHGQTYKVTAANLSAAVGLVIGFLLALSLRRMEAVIFGLLLGDTFALVAMLYFTRSRMPMSAVLQHLAWLFVPPLAAAASSFARSGFEAEIRCAVTLVGTIWVGLDVTFAYRQRVRRFLLA